MLRCLCSFLIGAMMIPMTVPAHAEDPLVFISAFAAGDQGGIHAYTLDVKAGALKPLHRTEGVQHPFFLAISKNNKFLYSIHAEDFGKSPNHVAAYALEGRTGKMKLLNRQSTHGAASCYLDVDATGKIVLVANYITGNVASYPVKADGSLAEAATVDQHAGKTVDPARQPGPHAHSFVISPDNKYAYEADLGLDRIFGYQLDLAKGTITPTKQKFARTPPRGGPRHLTFHPQQPWMYAINEIENSVTHYNYHAADGTLIERETISTIPDDFKETTNTADVKITPDGKFLYGTNRGHDSIACYQIAADGSLKLITIEPSRGKGPQNLAITAGGELLLCANMPDNNVVAFQIDKTTGKLKAVGEPVAIPSPSCILIR